jgi:hypothetical protein
MGFRSTIDASPFLTLTKPSQQPRLNILSDAADVAGIARLSLAIYATIGNSYSLLAQYLIVYISIIKVLHSPVYLL